MTKSRKQIEDGNLGSRRGVHCAVQNKEILGMQKNEKKIWKIINNKTHRRQSIWKNGRFEEL